MRLVAWNTSNRGATAGPHLAELGGDVAVLPEWGRIPMTPPAATTSFVEFGTQGERGLGVATWGDWDATAPALPPITGEVIGGVEIDGPHPFRLVAVWSALSGRPKVNPLAEALDAWHDWLGDGPVVVAGDFNTGGWWQDIKVGPMSHFPLVEQLGALGLHSAYHVTRGVEQGVDEEPTHWHNRGGTYMIDHVFTPTSWTIDAVTVGPEDPWRTRSDHAPLIVDVAPS